MNATWRTGDNLPLSSPCEEQYFNSFRQRASEQAQAINIQLGGTLCADLPTARLLTFDTDFKHQSNGVSDQCHFIKTIYICLE